MKLSLPQFAEVKGIFVGGCVERGEGSRFRRKAHAHTDNNDANFGWICFLSIKRVGIYTMNASISFDGEITKPSLLMLHEVAHILTGHGHDDKWRAKVHEIGGKLNSWEKKYHTGNWRNRHREVNSE